MVRARPLGRFGGALLTVVVLLGASIGCAGQSAVDQTAGGDQRFVAGDGTVSVYAGDERPPVPELTGELLDGSQWSLADVRGQVVVVNFWGSWCAPCRVEADELEAVFQATGSSGVAFVGVNLRDARDKATAFERAFGVTYPSLYDREGRVALAFRDTPPNATPATIVLDREHRVAAVFRAPLLRQDLLPTVEALAAEPGPAS